ncbi:MAG TPA: polyprenyl diphosphate synthase [Candidatus Saccharimonadales bacterium]|nr:polyprenyl diphosphate synthase [Candidatus Saccharimonadales bacterium]
MIHADQKTVPRHLGLILDGNRRWAKEHGLPIMEGHQKGYENLKAISEYAFEQGVEYVSAYVFSTENWNRSSSEVRNLMKLLLWILKHEVDNLSKHGIRVRALGSKVRLGKALVKAIHEAEEKTRDNDKGTLLLCLNYGGQQEIVDAMKQIVADGTPTEGITAELIEQHLYAPGVPPVDLIIRTSGEQRLSNFMLWEGAYSELMFTDTYWPDFTPEELQHMLVQYGNRQRRHGK